MWHAVDMVLFFLVAAPLFLVAMTWWMQLGRHIDPDIDSTPPRQTRIYPMRIHDHD